ncbi:MAG: glycosyltransferase family 2 protein, partial [Thermodesulfobacteriota bacterium]
NFVFDTEFLTQAVYFGFRIGDVPVPVRYFDEASSINFSNSVVYGIETLLTLSKYLIKRMKFGHYKLFSKIE